jgi:hypothetical protein
MTAGGGVLLTTTTGDIELTAGGVSRIDMKSDVDMFNNDIVNISNITSPNAIGIASTGSTMLLNTNNNDLSIVASGTGKVVLNGTSVDIGATKFQSSVDRKLGGVNVGQPIFQYGQINSTGTFGDQLVFLGVPYTTASFSVQVTMEGIYPASVSFAVLSSNSFRIYWSNANGSPQNINWLSYGD